MTHQLICDKSAAHYLLSMQVCTMLFIFPRDFKDLILLHVTVVGQVMFQIRLLAIYFLKAFSSQPDC